MATAVLHPEAQKFPAGTTVKAYLRSDQPAVWDFTGAPSGSQIASATVANDGSVTFTGLADGTSYVLWAGSPDRYASFSTPTQQSGDLDTISANTLSTSTGIGTYADAEVASGNAIGNTVIAILKRLRTLLAGGLPAALGSSGELKTGLATLIAGEDLTNNVQAILSKPHGSSGYAPSVYQSAGAVTKANLKATPGNVFAFRVTNANAAVRYFQLHNKASAPAATDVPQLSFILPAGTATVPAVLELSSADLAPCEYFATGIGWAISTTQTTFTDSATASEHNASVRYV